MQEFVLCIFSKEEHEGMGINISIKREKMQNAL